jgi:hypothetical protein
LLQAMALYWQVLPQNFFMPEDNIPQKDSRTDFFEKRETNANIDDKANAGDDGFTPIYLDDENVLQTPEEKQHDETVDPQKNDTVEATDIDNEETTFDKLNDSERDSSGGY